MRHRRNESWNLQLNVWPVGRRERSVAPYPTGSLACIGTCPNSHALNQTFGRTRRQSVRRVKER